MLDERNSPVNPSRSYAHLDRPETKSQAQVDRAGADLESHANLATTFRHSGWHHTRSLIAASFRRTDQPASRRSNFSDCGSFASILQSVDDPAVYRVAGSSCHDRFCLPCARERSHLIANNVIEQVANKKIRFLTLTVKSKSEDLATLLHRLYQSFSALRRRAFWKRRVTGGVAFLEVKWATSAGRWHPHLHVLIEGRYMPKADIRRIWYDITKDSFIIDIRLVQSNEHAARYVTKYASKPFNNTFVGRPLLLDEAVNAMKGRKLAMTFGSWRGVTLSKPIDKQGWKNLGSLQDFLTRAAHNDSAARAVLSALTDANLSDIYARAPPLEAPVLTKTPRDEQQDWLGIWSRSGDFNCDWDTPTL